MLSKPLRYLSHYLERHRQEYYDRLQAVREHGHWEGWVEFFLRGVDEVATEANSTAKKILVLREQHRGRLAHAGRAASNLLRAHDVLFENPIVTPKLLEQRLGVSFATANNWVVQLTQLGIMEETTGNRRNRRSSTPRISRCSRIPRTTLTAGPG